MKDDTKALLSKPLLIALVILGTISVIGIASSTPLITKGVPSTYWVKQLIFYILSFGLLFFLYHFGSERIYRGMWIIYGILMVFLVGLLIERVANTYLSISIVPLAKQSGGAWSWYNFPGFQFQPSEFMKIAIILCLSDIIDCHNEQYVVHNFANDLKLVGKVMAVTLPPCILIYLQNDAGVTMIILISVIFILFGSGIHKGWFIVGILGIIAIIGILVYIFLYQHDVFVQLIGSEYKLNRFYGWLDPEGTYKIQGFQLFNSLLAYGTAGIFGHGFQSVIINIPEAQTDFIFAVICQGFGLIGGFITIVSIAAFDLILLRICFRSKNNRDKYFITGIMGLLLFQQIWNISMVMGIVPITGITLPLISYGGSSLLSYMIAIGIIFDIEKQTRIKEGKNKSYNFTNYF